MLMQFSSHMGPLLIACGISHVESTIMALDLLHSAISLFTKRYVQMASSLLVFDFVDVDALISLRGPMHLSTLSLAIDCIAAGSTLFLRVFTCFGLALPLTGMPCCSLSLLMPDSFLLGAILLLRLFARPRLLSSVFNLARLTSTILTKSVVYSDVLLPVSNNVKPSSALTMKRCARLSFSMSTLDHPRIAFSIPSKFHIKLGLTSSVFAFPTFSPPLAASECIQMAEAVLVQSFGQLGASPLALQYPMLGTFLALQSYSYLDVFFLVFGGHRLRSLASALKVVRSESLSPPQSLP